MQKMASVDVCVLRKLRVALAGSRPDRYETGMTKRLFGIIPVILFALPADAGRSETGEAAAALDHLVSACGVSDPAIIDQQRAARIAVVRDSARPMMLVEQMSIEGQVRAFGADVVCEGLRQRFNAKRPAAGATGR